MHALIKLAVEQRVLVNLAFVLLIGVGVFTYIRLPVDAWPEVSLDEVWITTIWPGAGAEEVERLITRKIEDEIRDLSGIKRIVSNSQPGLSLIDVKFEEDLEPLVYAAAVDDLKNALDRVTDLPEDAEEPLFQRLTTGEVYPLFTVLVAATDDTLSDMLLREAARDLKRAIAAVPGVQRVRYNGYRDREFQVLIDRVAARRHGVSLAEVLQALQRTNISMPAGSIERGENVASVPLAEQSEVRLKFDMEFHDPYEIADAIVRVVPGHDPIRVRDIGRVEPGFERERMIASYMGKRALALNVSKALDGDTLTLRDDCGVIITEFLERSPVGIDVEIIADQSEIVRSRLGVLLDNLMQGLLIVCVLLFFSIGIRNALIALVGLPFSYLCCFLLFPTLDLTINNLTLFGMVLVGGMLVDDAVVVIENMYRHVEKGMPVRDAVLRGASEVAWPVTTAVLTTMAAMLPLLLQGGVTGKFFSYIPKVVILALVFSLVQCVTVLPVHYLEFGARRSDGASASTLSRMRNGVFGALTSVYLKALGYVLRFRAAFFTVLVGGSILLVGLVLNIPQDPWISDFNAIMATIQCDPSSSLRQTADATRLVDEEWERLHQEGLIKNYHSLAGFSMTSDGVFIQRPDVAFFLATLEDSNEISANPERIVNTLRKRLDERLAREPEWGIQHAEVFAPRDGPPLGKPVAVRVESTDYRLAKTVSEEIKAELRSIEGVYSIADNFNLGPREYRFRLDGERAAAMGFFPADAGLALAAANGGIIVGSYKDRKLDEDVDIRVQYAAADRRDAADLLVADARGEGGSLVPLADISRVDVWRPNLSYYHYDAERTVLVTADVDGVTATGPQVNEDLKRRFRDVAVRYPGVRLHFGGEFEETRKSMAQQQQSFWVALVLVYVLLAAQFRSYRQPFIVMAVVPFGVLGVLLGLWVRGQPFTIPTFIAMIGLAGVVVNESLVLVAFINLRRAEGLGLMEAICLAGQQRLRPILLTAGTTIGNLIPLAFGFGGSSRVWTPFAVSIVFGMAVASVMTLFLVPALYSVFYRK